MSMIVTRNGRDARRIESSGVPAEDFLQAYIAQNPGALPFSELRADIRLMVVVRELPTSSGSIDAVAVDGDGNVYLIETKLYRNPDKRRVLAQVMDYGAALWDTSGGGGAFRERLEAASRRASDEPLADRIAAYFGLDLEASDELLDTADAQVAKGRMRFVVLMDRIDATLKNLITFINGNSRFDVYGVELQFYRFDDYEVTIPRLYGAEARKEVDSGATSSRRRWDEASFYEDAEERLTPEQVAALRKLHAFAKEHADHIGWGTGATGSFNPRFRTISPRSAFTARSNGALYLNVGWWPDDDGNLSPAAMKLLERIRQIEPLGLEAVDLERFPLVGPDVWVPQVGTIIGAIRDVLRIDDA